MFCFVVFTERKQNRYGPLTLARVLKGNYTTLFTNRKTIATQWKTQILLLCVCAYVVSRRRTLKSLFIPTTFMQYVSGYQEPSPFTTCLPSLLLPLLKMLIECLLIINSCRNLKCLKCTNIFPSQNPHFPPPTIDLLLFSTTIIKTVLPHTPSPSLLDELQ